MRRRNSRVDAEGDGSFAAGRDIHDIVATVNNYRMEPATSAGGASGSVLPPVQLLPTHVRGRERQIAKIADTYRWRKQSTGHPDAVSLGMSGSILILHGMGGIGKSAIALAVAKRLSKTGIKVFWINAAEKATAQAGLWRAARDLDPEMPGSLSDPGAVDAVWDVLERTSARWLIVFDNADDPQVLAADPYRTAAGNGWLRNGRGMTIVTSRVSHSPAWPANISSVRVGPLDPVSGRKLLIDLTSPGEKVAKKDIVAAEDLAARLGGIPLALRAAGHYLALGSSDTDSGRFAAYSAALDKRFSTMVDAGTRHLLVATGAKPDARDMVMATWDLSLDFLADQGQPDARVVVSLLALFANAPISLTLLKAGIAELALLPVDQLPELLAGLVRLGLIDEVATGTPDADEIVANHTVVMHPLVAEVFAEKAKLDRPFAKTLDEAIVGGLSSVVDQVAGDSDLRLDVSILESHCRRTAARLLSVATDRRFVFQFVKAIAGGYERLLIDAPRDVSIEAITVYEELAVKAGGERSKFARHFRHQRGHRLWHAYRFEEAIPAFRDSARGQMRLIWRVAGPEDAMKIQTVICGLPPTPSEGSYLPSESVDAMVSATPIAMLFWAWVWRMPFLRKNRTALRVRHKIALGLLYREKPMAAERQFRSISDHYLKASGPDHLHTLDAQADLAYARLRCGRAAEAEAEHRRILVKALRLLGPENRRTLRYRALLALDLDALGEGLAAEAEFEMISMTLTQTLGPEHEETLIARTNLAKQLFDNQKYRQALTEFRSILTTQRHGAQDDRLDTLTTRRSIGRALYKLDELEAAERELRAVLASLTSLMGAEHSEVLETRHDLAHVLYDLGNESEALREHKQVVDIAKAAKRVAYANCGLNSMLAS